MAEEVRSLLANVPHLKVVGRTSSFQFKGKKVDLRTIGSLLGVGRLVEGSVRKAGSRVRVNAELIDASSGVREWSQSYDRDYGDVLAMQDQEIEHESPMGSRDAGLAIVYHALGRKADSDQALARLINEYGDLWPSIVAQVYTYRGETNLAFEWLDKALVARPQYFAMTIRTDPFLAPLRGDPRFTAVLRKMDLAAVD